MHRVPQHTRNLRLRRYLPRVEDLERREAPSLLLYQAEDWLGEIVSSNVKPDLREAATHLQAAALPTRSDRLDLNLFDLPPGLGGETQNVALVPALAELQTASAGNTQVGATYQGAAFAPGADTTPARRDFGTIAEPPATAPAASTAELLVSVSNAMATSGNNLFASPAAAGSAEALWSALNNGQGQAGPNTGEFTETLFASGGNLSGATGMAWAPDGTHRLFITRQTGQVMIIENGAVRSTPFATIAPIYTSSECGLIGIAFDPDYITNHYIYFFVTVSNSEQQIIRYLDVNNVGTDKTTIVAGLPTRGANHDGGAVGFGIDGKLYWAIGDLGGGVGVNEDLTSLAAKVGRANRDGSVPGDNPYDDGPGPNNDYIWAAGLRNPFTFTFQPTTYLLWVNSVGTSYEQVFVMAGGEHAGYNRYENNQPEGYLPPVIKYRTNGTDSRTIQAGGAVRSGGIATFTHNAPPSNLVFRRGERLTISGVADASFNGDYYILDVPTPNSFRVVQKAPDATSGGGTAVTLNQGGCLTGGTFYNSTGFASDYHGNFFYGDCNSGRMMRATLDANNEVTSVDHFRRPLTNSYIDADVGPDGALYSVYNGGQVFRLAYNQVEQHLVIGPQWVTLDEGGQAAFSVSLAMQPESDVVVTTTYVGGHGEVVVSYNETITFTPADWSTPQPVFLYSYEDADSDLGLTFFEVSAKGMASEYVYATSRDSIS